MAMAEAQEIKPNQPSTWQAPAQVTSVSILLGKTSHMAKFKFRTAQGSPLWGQIESHGQALWGEDIYPFCEVV